MTRADRSQTLERKSSAVLPCADNEKYYYWSPLNCRDVFPDSQYDTFLTPDVSAAMKICSNSERKECCFEGYRYDITPPRALLPFFFVLEFTLLFILRFSLNFLCLKRWMPKCCILHNGSSVRPDFHWMACYDVLYRNGADQRQLVSVSQSLATFQNSST